MTAVLVTEEVAAKLVKNRAEHAQEITPGVVIAMTPAFPGRALADIEKDVAALSKVQRRNVFTMGALLIEAKARVLTGDWLPWLQKHFGNSERTAQNYMGAARLLVRNATVAELKLSDGAIYWLADHSAIAESEQPHWVVPGESSGIGFDGKLVSTNAVAEILEAAKTSYVNAQFCREAYGRQKEKHYNRKNFAARKAASELLPPRPNGPPHPHTAATKAARKAVQDVRAEHRATMSPAEIKAENDKSQLHGSLTAAVKVIARLAPSPRRSPGPAWKAAEWSNAPHSKCGCRHVGPYRPVLQDTVFFTDFGKAGPPQIGLCRALPPSWVAKW
jgi:hypothetical protein